MGRNENALFSPFYGVVLVTTKLSIHPDPSLFLLLTFNNYRYAFTANH